MYFKNAALSILSLSLLPFCAHSQDMTATGIVERANDIMNQESMFAKAKMVITTTSGSTRELFYDSWSKYRGEKNLIKYTGPRRIQGQAMLLLNNADDIWSYDPRTNRVRKLATHAKKQKMQGSDFSYEDMGTGETFVTDYLHSRLNDEEKEGRDCYVIELSRTDKTESNYSRMKVWVDKQSFVLWVIEYFDEKNPDLKIKTLIQTDLEIIDGIPTPTKITMQNHLDNTTTRMELLEVMYNTDIDDELFTERGLRK
ncbi:outer membrane lipoprotein-sorting protein [candidate division KSB1 bacterium]